MRFGSTLYSVAGKELACLIIVMAIAMLPIAHGIPEPIPYQCPHSNAHVWNKDQCLYLIGGGGPAGFPGSGGGRGGLLGIIGDAVGGLSGLL